MTYDFKRSFICLLAVCAAAPVSAHPADDAINAVYGGLIKARVESDIAGMIAPFPTEAILIDSRPGPALGGGAELEARLRPMAARLATEGVKVKTQYRIERRSVTGEVAMDAGYMRMEMTRPNGQTGARYARFLVTMRRDEAGEWRILGDAAMPSDEAAWNAVDRKEGLRHDG
jgi:ketosteroid isomerase-like protein